MCNAFDRLYNQIRYENQKRQNEYFIEFCKMLKLLNFCGNYHCFCPGNENYCAYRNHSVYEKVAEYFKKRRQNVWRNDADDSLYPVVAQNCRLVSQLSFILSSVPFIIRKGVAKK